MFDGLLQLICFCIYVSINSIVFYIPPCFSALHVPLIFDIFTAATKNIRNMHAVSTNEIVDIFDFNNNVLYGMDTWQILYQSISFIYNIISGKDLCVGKSI